MEGLTFTHLQAVYQLDYEYRKLKDDNYVSQYSCQWLVDADYNPASKAYEFRLDRKDIKINRKGIEKLMDKIVFEIGSSLYPVCFMVSDQMEITQIINYKEIAGRWNEVTEKCRNEHPGDIIERYIQNSAESFTSPKALLGSLYGDSFINAYFRNLYKIPETKEVRERMEWFNFPLREMKSTYYCIIEKPEEYKRKLEGPLMAILLGQEGQARIDFTYGAYGEPEEIDGLFTATSDLKQYQKKIQIQVLEKKADKQNNKR